MLKISNIRKRYAGHSVLENVGFNVADSSITGVIGPNGAGKSTLLDIITGFRHADGGSVAFNGEPLESFTAKKNIFSYMPEHLDIYPDYLVYDFIRFIQRSTNHVDAALVTALNLDSVAGKRVRHLSKGYHQRLKLFSALSNKKRIVVLDEPFDGFDPIQLMDILELIKRENKNGRTFILSIHQLYDAEKICDHYVLLDDGAVVADGDLPALRELYCDGDIDAPLERIFIRALQ
ncbi:MAG: ABC transporter ATP-binding protein [Kiritimatiellaeota bacterium]|nr:ABC transporter ATP-binding protein [Kiritimatiellota bacterium]